MPDSNAAVVRRQRFLFRSGMLASPLFWRFLFPIVIVVLSFTAAIYAFSVPYLKKLVYSLEERAVLTNLNNVHELVRANYLAIEAYKQAVLDAHKRQLKNITLFEEAYIKNKYEEFRSGLLTEEEAKTFALEELKRFRYGNDNYVWVADLSGRFLSHPDPEMDGKDFSEVRDVFGNYVLTPLIEKVLANDEGYHSYWWQRLGQDVPAEQLIYARIFPQWGWVIGTGVYLDDLEAEVILRKEKMIDELRQILLPIRIARTGYMYIFDAWKNIIIHPDAKLENTNMGEIVDPATGHSLAEELMAAATTDTHTLHYLWDRPDDPGNFSYEKIDWVKYVDGFNWYIVASVYTDDLNASSNALRDKIIIASVAIFIATSLLIALLVGRLLTPIQELTQTASRVQEGDLSARCEITRNDEIGFLATTFNAMVGQLRRNIEELDQKVMERTRELDEKNAQLTANVAKLEQRNREISLLNAMGERLQACRGLEETYPVAIEIAAALFPTAGGALYMMDETSGLLRRQNVWNGFSGEPAEFAVDDCWAIRHNRSHLFTTASDGQPCRHLRLDADTPEGPATVLCLPLAGHNEMLGMLHLRWEEPQAAQSEDLTASRKNLAVTVADHLAMAMANLKLRERLHRLSVRDGLTGLFNRRYMEETLVREFKRAERQKLPIGVIILDVDFFKKFNDTYGHEAGDVVLKTLARHMQHKVRQGDIVCRYGGEEFVIIMPGSAIDQTVERAEEIRRSVEEEMRPTYGSEVFQVTISMGAAAFPDHGQTPEEVLGRADAALYRSKDAGRNRVTAAS